jgi:hypothetical protein
MRGGIADRNRDAERRRDETFGKGYVFCDGTLRNNCDGASSVSANAACKNPATGTNQSNRRKLSNTTTPTVRAKGAAARAAVGAISGNACKGAATGMVVGGMAHYWQHKAERMRTNEPWSRWLRKLALLLHKLWVSTETKELASER